jgi:hypothetical protein
MVNVAHHLEAAIVVEFARSRHRIDFASACARMRRQPTDIRIIVIPVIDVELLNRSALPA